MPRGVEIAPSTVALHAEMLRVEQRPFGRSRSALRAIRMLKSGGGDVITLIKNSSDDDPRWLRPPERAGYPVHTTTDRYAAIELDRGAHDWLARVWSEAPRRLGHLVLVDVWLGRDEEAGETPSDLVANIGEHRVGAVPAPATASFEQVMHAAAMFDEDPVLTGRLSRPEGQTSQLLEIPAPHHP